MDAGLSAVGKDMRARLESEIVAAMGVACADIMQWGKDDCALWVANIIQKTCDYDPASPWRGRYKTQRGAHRVIGKGGLLSVFRRAARKHGWQRIPSGHARPGDVGLIVNVKGVLSSVIYRGNGYFVGRNERGITAVKADKVVICWSLDRNDVIAASGVRVHFPRISSRPRLTETSAVCHEPISAVIGLTALIEGLGASAAVAGAIGGIIVGATLSVGLSYLSSLLTPKPGTPDLSGLSDTQQSSQITERQPTPSKRVIFGSAYVGGALFFEQVKAPYLFMGVLINYGEIAGVDAIWIGTNELTFTTISFNTILTPLPIAGQPDYTNHLQVSLRAGTTGQGLDSILSANFSPLDSNFLQEGIATAVYRYHYGGTDNSAATQANFTALWGQVARPSAYTLVRGVKVYDPRDPTQDLNDETTWKWSNNASLVQAYYLTRQYGGRISKASILWDKVAIAANFDDEAVGCADGTFIKRHTIDGVTTLNQKPSDVMTQMLTANNGSVIQSGGNYWVTSSRPRSAIATIHDAILSGAIEVRSAQPKANMLNKLQVRFVAQEQDYQTIDGPILERTDLEANDQQTLTGTLELPYTLDYRRAERLQKQFLERSRLGKTFTCTVDIAFLAYLDDELIGEAVNVSSDLFPIANGLYLCNSVGFADDMSTLALTLTEYDPSIETDWDPSVDETAFTVVNPLA